MKQIAYLFFTLSVLSLFHCSNPPKKVDFTGRDSLNVVLDELKANFDSTRVIPIQISAENEIKIIKDLLEEGLDPAETEMITLILEIAKYQGKLNNLLERLWNKNENGISIWERIIGSFENKSEAFDKLYMNLFRAALGNSGLSMLSEENASNVMNEQIGSKTGKAGSIFEMVSNRNNAIIDISPGFRKAAIAFVKEVSPNQSEKSSFDLGMRYLSWTNWMTSQCYDKLKYRYKRPFRSRKTGYLDNQIEVEILNDYDEEILVQKAFKLDGEDSLRARGRRKVAVGKKYKFSFTKVDNIKTSLVIENIKVFQIASPPWRSLECENTPETVLLDVD